jgi:hypothetical protein
MPTVEQNLQTWGQDFDWANQGDEWSGWWGDAEAQWFGSILPRIHAFASAPTILEIAPGFGRWTEFLRRQCLSLVVVDLAENCIAACRRRFASDSHITYHVNDGRSLEMISDNSVDFVFSFDSLVHADADVIGGYLSQLATKLTPNGVGFIHHSNAGAYQRAFSRMKRIPGFLGPAMTSVGYLDIDRWRSFTMTARVFEQSCEAAGLRCIGQELVNWGTRRMIDCFSLFTKADSVWARPNRVVENPNFMKEAAFIKRWAHVYSSAGFVGAAPPQSRAGQS